MEGENERKQDKLDNTNLKSREDCKSYNHFKVSEVCKFLNHAGFELFSDTRSYRSTDMVNSRPRVELIYDTDPYSANYKKSYITPSNDFSGFSFDQMMDRTQINPR